MKAWDIYKVHCRVWKYNPSQKEEIEIKIKDKNLAVSTHFHLKIALFNAIPVTLFILKKLV